VANVCHLGNAAWPPTLLKSSQIRRSKHLILFKIIDWLYGMMPKYKQSIILNKINYIMVISTATVEPIYASFKTGEYLQTQFIKYRTCACKNLLTTRSALFLDKTFWLVDNIHWICKIFTYLLRESLDNFLISKWKTMGRFQHA